MSRGVLAMLRHIAAEDRMGNVMPVLLRAASLSAAAIPFAWWRWTAYLSVGITRQRMSGILATGKDPFGT